MEEEKNEDDVELISDEEEEADEDGVDLAPLKTLQSEPLVKL